MSSDYKPSTASNPALEAALANAQTPNEVRELTLQILAAQGQIVRSRDDEFNHQVLRQPQPVPASAPAASAPAAAERCMRIFCPHNNDKFEIYGVSEMELDEKERQIRAMYGRTR
jgi:hypothetical protein